MLQCTSAELRLHLYALTYLLFEYFQAFSNSPPGKDGKLVCLKCDKRFSRKDSLTRHMLVHTGHYKFYCDQCKKGFMDTTSYNEHMRRHEGLRHHCEHCSKPFNSRLGLQLHLSVHTGQYKHWCFKCGKGFNTKMTFERHNENHWKLDEEWYRFSSRVDQNRNVPFLRNWWPCMQCSRWRSWGRSRNSCIGKTRVRA